MPGMPHGKPAGVPCIHLDADYRCRLYGHPDRPACCSGLQPGIAMCGTDRDAALRGLMILEQLTRPASAPSGVPTASWLATTDLEVRVFVDE